MHVCIDPFDSFEAVQRSLITLRMECGVTIPARFKLDVMHLLKIPKDHKYDIPPSMYIASRVPEPTHTDEQKPGRKGPFPCSTARSRGVVDRFDESLVVRTCVHIPRHNWCQLRSDENAVTLAPPPEDKSTPPDEKPVSMDTSHWARGMNPAAHKQAPAATGTALHAGTSPAQIMRIDKDLGPTQEPLYWNVLPSDKLDVAVYFGHFEAGTSINFFASEARFQGCKVLKSKILPSSKGHTKVSGFIHVDSLEGASKLVASLLMLAKRKGKSVVVKVEKVHKVGNNGESVRVLPTKKPTSSSSMGNRLDSALLTRPATHCKISSNAHDETASSLYGGDERSLSPETPTTVVNRTGRIDTKIETASDQPNAFKGVLSPMTSPNKKSNWNIMTKGPLPFPEFLSSDEFPILTVIKEKKTRREHVSPSSLTPVVLDFQASEDTTPATRERETVEIFDDMDKEVVREKFCGEYNDDGEENA